MPGKEQLSTTGLDSGDLSTEFRQLLTWQALDRELTILKDIEHRLGILARTTNEPPTDFTETVNEAIAEAQLALQETVRKLGLAIGLVNDHIESKQS